MRLLTFCFRNLLRRKVRTALCIMGVALAATFVIAVGATTMRYTTVIREMNVLFNGQVLVVGKDTIVIQAVPITRSFLPQQYTLDKLQEVDGVEKAVPILFVTPNVQIIEPVPVNFTIGMPVDDWNLVIGSAQLRKGGGHFPTSDSSNEVVVGCSLADQYNLTTGTELTIESYRLNITGILETKIALLTRSVLMPLELTQNIYNYQRDINMVTVKPSAGYMEKDLKTAIEQKVDYVNALTQEERNDMIEPVLAQVEMWNLGISTVVFAMSLILVMTVTVMSVSERRRDFATLDAIGAPLGYVFRVILLETALIGVIGGILGIVCGSFAAILLASLYTNIPVSQFIPSTFEIVPPLYMAEMLAAVIAVCCFGGIVPAINATKMRVAEVLRAEY